MAQHNRDHPPTHKRQKSQCVNLIVFHHFTNQRVRRIDLKANPIIELLTPSDPYQKNVSLDARDRS